MFGQNLIRKPVLGDGTSLDIVSIFPTLQGEGPYAGWPAIFIRLGGCNLACSFCDTEFESFNSETLDHIISTVKTLHTNQKLIVITGGEPFRQPIKKLCEELVAMGFKIQIETNGTLYREIPTAVEIICSPKTSTALRPDLLQRLTAMKFIISSTNQQHNHVPELGQRSYNIPVYVQPMDEQNAEKNLRNLEYTRDLALEYGYILSLQLHKLIGIE